MNTWTAILEIKPNFVAGRADGFRCIVARYNKQTERRVCTLKDFGCGKGAYAAAKAYRDDWNLQTEEISLRVERALDMFPPSN